MELLFLGFLAEEKERERIARPLGHAQIIRRTSYSEMVLETLQEQIK